MVKIAMEALASCSGCEISILDLHEDLVKLLDQAEIVYAPIIMDVKEIPDDIDIAIVSGSVRNSENKERLEELREKSKYLIAYGTCACYGGITGMADLTPLKRSHLVLILTTPVLSQLNSLMKWFQNC
jgi:F420-non-reducing hydrogenase small subunit